MPDAKEIIKAVKTGNTARVRELLDADPALLRAQEADGTTLLHWAAWKGFPEVAAILLERGAEVRVQNNNTHWGGTPLHTAAHGNQKAVAELLIAHGAEVSLRSQNGRTPLEETTIHKATAVAKLLKQYGAVE